MIAVILAAGYATRLYPLTENMPKCLLKVGGITILDRLARELDGIPAISKVVLVTNARFYGQLSSWSRGAGISKPLEVINDETTSNENRLGALGDLGLAIRKAAINEDLLLLASDNLYEERLSHFIDDCAGRDKQVCVGVYDIKDPSLAAKKYGVIEVDGESRVISIEEKPEFPRSSLIGVGVYFFPKETLRFVSDYLADKNAKDAPGYYVAWLVGKCKIFTHTFRGLWYDIGDFKALEEANNIFQSKLN